MYEGNVTKTMADLRDVDCPYCGNSTDVLVPEERTPVETVRSVVTSSPPEACGVVWTRCEYEHKFVVYYD